jgi:small subunit ribosomal protein S21
MEGGGCVTKVIVEPDESFESALKRFKKQCENAGLLSEFKKRQHYEKPSVRRKRKAWRLQEPSVGSGSRLIPD